MNKTRFYGGQDNLIKNMYVAMLVMTSLVFLWAIFMSVEYVVVQRNYLFVAKARLVNEICGPLGGSFNSNLSDRGLEFNVVCNNEINTIINGKIVTD